MSVPIGFDAASGSIVIMGNRAFPARTLTASVSDELPDRIQIDDIAGRGEQMVFWSDVTSLDGSYAPSSMADALAYLTSEFAKSCPVGETFGVPAATGADLIKGQPVAVSRASGRLLPARADTYSLAFVAGLASADTVSGFADQPAHGAVTLADWTLVAGTPSLFVGQLYFLGTTGGLTTAPDLTAACITRVGLATAPQTLVAEPAHPIIL